MTPYPRSLRNSTPTARLQTNKRGHRSRFGAALIFGIAAACVTVNVNFPEGAVQKATDDYVRELYKSKSKSTQPVPSPSPASVKSDAHPPVSFSFWGIATAEASEPQFKVDTPKAKEIQARQAARVEELLEYKRSGQIGESMSGLAVSKITPDTKPLLRKKIEKLVEEENMDRKELYSEVLRANGLAPNWLTQIQKSFARSFQNLSPSGTPTEASEGKWEAKP